MITRIKKGLVPARRMRINIQTVSTALGTLARIKMIRLDIIYIGKPMSRTVGFSSTLSCARILECPIMSKCITSVISDFFLTSNITSHRRI